MSLLPLIVARYLQSTYPAVLDPFLAHASLPESTLNDPDIHVPDLRTLVAEYDAWLLERRLGATTIAPRPRDGDPRQMVRRPMVPEVRDTLLQRVRKTWDRVGTGGFLAVQWGKVAKREFDTRSASYRASYPSRIIVTSTDKTLKTIDPETGEVDQILEPHKAAILSFAVHPTQPRYIVTTSMDSTAILTDLITQQPLQTFPHAKFVVRCAFSRDGRWLATASYDRTIILYQNPEWDASPAPAEEDDPVGADDDPRLARDPALRFHAVHKIVVDQNPEAIVFDAAGRYLLYTTRNSHVLTYVHLPTGPSPASGLGSPHAFRESTKSFNVHPQDRHISFSVLNVVLDPTGTLLACQTGDHAGGTGERVLIYDINLSQTPEPRDDDDDATPDDALTTRAHWLGGGGDTQREDERLATIWTGEPGDPYVLPRLAWLPDSTGLITTTPNGSLILHSLGTGEQVARLKVHGRADGSGVGGRPVGRGASEVVRDVAVFGEPGDVRGWRVVSVGYDATVRIC